MPQDGIANTVGGNGPNERLMHPTNTGYTQNARVVVALGSNQYGQLGSGSSEDASTPQVVLHLGNACVTSVHAGGTHSALVDADGVLWMWGGNNVGQLGLGDGSEKMRVAPTRVPLPERVTRVSLGFDTTAVVTEGGRCFMWGSNRNAQCSFPCSRHDTHSCDSIFSPREVQISKELKTLSPRHVCSDAVAGVSCGLRHSLLWMTCGCLFGAGSNRFCQLAYPDRDHGSALRRIIISTKTEECPCACPANQSGHSIVCASAGSAHSIVSTSCGRVFAFGDNKHCQLAIQKMQPEETSVRRSKTWFHDPVEVEIGDYRVQSVVAVTAGWSTSAVVLSDGHVYIWGRGDYGQTAVIPRSVTSHVPTMLSHQVKFLQGGTSSPLRPLFSMGAEHCVAVFAGVSVEGKKTEDRLDKPFTNEARQNFSSEGDSKIDGFSERRTAQHHSRDKMQDIRVELEKEQSSQGLTGENNCSQSHAGQNKSNQLVSGRNESSEGGMKSDISSQGLVCLNDANESNGGSGCTSSKSLLENNKRGAPCLCWGWGWNDHYQLGGTVNDNWTTPAPLQVRGTVLDMSAGGGHTLFLISNEDAHMTNEDVI
eukprot:Rmarinus@m.5631